MTNEDFLKAFKCSHYESVVYEDERPRHRCTKLEIRCEGPCEEYDPTEAGTDAIEFVETWRVE